MKGSASTRSVHLETLVIRKQDSRIVGQSARAMVSENQAQEALMSKGRDRSVYQRDDGRWANERNDASRASSLHDTQAEAQRAAREMLRNQAGGELTTMGTDGKIRA